MEDVTWFIPLTYRTESEHKNIELKDRVTTIELSFEKYVHLNCNSLSFLRVEYDDLLIDKLIQKENVKMMTRYESQQLIDDA